MYTLETAKNVRKVKVINPRHQYCNLAGEEFEVVNETRALLSVRIPVDKLHLVPTRLAQGNLMTIKREDVLDVAADI